MRWSQSSRRVTCPGDSRYLVALRQACAENRIADAERLFSKVAEEIADDPSIAWLSQLILGHNGQAVDVLREYNARDDMTTMTSFLTYGTFDARPYPNLMALLESEGIERGELVKLPYQCRH